MKRMLQISMVLCTLLVIAGSAWSYSLLDGTDVGGLDAFIASDKLQNSGDDTELAWVETVTGIADFVMDAKYADMGWLQTDTAGVYAIALRYNPAYFLVKTGAGSSTGDDHFLLENLASPDWGVVSLADLGFSSNKIGKISHVDEFKGTTSVPEPLTVLLLGFGLVGLGGARRFLK